MITVSSLRIALNSPAIHFRRLKNIRWDEEHITLSTYFATTRVRLGSVRYLLCLPLREESMRRAERFITLHKHLECTAVPRLEIFRDEMSYLSSAEQELKSDILLEPLPNALPLTDAIATLCSEEAGRLLEGINKLEQQLLKADVSHNNIREEHLLINRFGTIFPIRWYYATASAGGDAEAFAAIRQRIAASNTTRCNTDSSIYSRSELDKYLFVSTMHEGLIAVESHKGWGYVDYNCHEVIKPQYLWANDFCEGRAEVQTKRGMGLIDKQGNYIIDPIYEAVEFDVEKGVVRVCQQKRWALFDYSGNQLCDWAKNIGGATTTVNELR